MYQSGHNEPDSKSTRPFCHPNSQTLTWWAFPPFPTRWFCCFSTLFLRFVNFSIFNIFVMERCPRGLRCDSRKVVFRKEPWVRIPLSPPLTSLSYAMHWAGFYLAQIRLLPLCRSESVPTYQGGHKYLLLCWMWNDPAIPVSASSAPH